MPDWYRSNKKCSWQWVYMGIFVQHSTRISQKFGSISWIFLDISPFHTVPWSQQQWRSCASSHDETISMCVSTPLQSPSWWLTVVGGCKVAGFCPIRSLDVGEQPRWKGTDAVGPCRAGRTTGHGLEKLLHKWGISNRGSWSSKYVQSWGEQWASHESRRSVVRQKILFKKN